MAYKRIVGGEKNLKSGQRWSKTEIIQVYHLYKKLNENVFKINDRIMLICMASGLVLGILVFKMNNMISRYGNNN